MTMCRKACAIPLMVMFVMFGTRTSAALAQVGVVEGELNGPGPLVVVQIPFDRLLCLIQEGPPVEMRTTGTVLGRSTIADIACTTDGAGEPMRVLAHLSAEYTFGFGGRFGDTADDFPDLVTTSFKPLLFYRLHENIDVGIGVAAHRFSGADYSGNDFHFWRFAVPLRARLTWPWIRTESRWRALYLSIQGDYFPGEIRGSDFRAKPASPGASFREANAFVTSFAIGVDVIKVITGRWRFV